jgi:hypothetical protein
MNIKYYIKKYNINFDYIYNLLIFSLKIQENDNCVSISLKKNDDSDNKVSDLNISEKNQK